MWNSTSNNDFPTDQTLHQMYDIDTELDRQGSICNGCGVPATGNAYSSGHLVAPFFGLAYMLLLLRQFFRNCSLWIFLGTLLTQTGCIANQRNLNLCIIELFSGVFCFVTLLFEFLVGAGTFVIGLSQFSFLFSALISWWEWTLCHFQRHWYSKLCR